MELHGKSVFGGIAIGRISVHKKDEQQVNCHGQTVCLS